VSGTPAEPFTRASIYLGPLLEAHGFKAIAREYDEAEEGSASAEYRAGEIALRLVWEGEERALWVERARASGGAVISRWIDVEWIASGERREVDTALDDARLERLAAALRRVLSSED
jgi:hypothetical protein